MRQNKINYKAIMELLGKIALCSFFGFFSSCHTKADKEVNGWQKDNLQGHVKSFNEFKYKAIEKYGDFDFFDTQIEDHESNFSNQYDSMGNLIEKIKYRRNKFGRNNSESIYKITYNYDDNQRITEENRFFYDDLHESLSEMYYNIKAAGKNVYVYDDKGILNEIFNFIFKGDIEYKITFTYDKNQKLRENLTYGGVSDSKRQDNLLAYNKVVYEYDKMGNLNEKSCYYQTFGGWELDCKDTFRYDKNGNKIEESRFMNYGDESNLSLDYSISYKYDKNSNIIEKVRFNSEKTITDY
jgi:hypothetical protein